MFRIFYLEKFSAQPQMLYDSTMANSLIVIPSEVSFKIKQGDDVDIELYSNHPLYDRFTSLKEEVYFMEDEKIIFRGRIVKVSEILDKSGGKVKKITLMSVDYYFNDMLVTKDLFPVGTRTIEDFIKRIFDYLNRYNRYSIRYKSNTYSKNLSKIGLGEIKEKCVDKTLGECLDILAEYNECFFRKNHSPIDLINKSGIVTEIECVPFSFALNNQKEHDLIYGKDIVSLEQTLDYSLLYNHIDVKSKEGNDNIVENSDSIATHGLVETIKEEKEISDLALCKSIATALVEKYQKPQKEVECEFYDISLIKDGVKRVLEIGDYVKIYFETGELIYQDVIAEISYNPLMPEAKNIVLGKEKLNLFKTYQL